MSKNAGELINLLKSFGETDDQAWNDCGHELSEEFTAKFKNEDWEEFVERVADLENGQFFGVLTLISLVPEYLHIALLKELLRHAKGTSWIETLELISDIFVDSPEKFETDIATEDLLPKFEREIVRWINFPKLNNESFEDYYGRYLHLINSNTKVFYEFLQNTHNKALQPTQKPRG